MYWIGVVLATIGASLILGALTFVSGRSSTACSLAGGAPRPVEAAGQSSSGVGASGVVAERMAAS